MNIDFYSRPLEKAIVREIMQWSDSALEKPNPFFNNLPPCPYAKQAWADDKVAVLFKEEDSYQVLYSCISQFDDHFNLAIVVDLANNKEPDPFHEYLASMNDFISTGAFIDKDIWLMGFHPEDEPSDFVKDLTFDYEVDTAYSMIFVQRLSKLHEAAEKLNKNGYYNSYTDEYDASDIYHKRQTLYGKLKNGDET